MNPKKKQTSDAWCKEKMLRVISPIGWDRTNFTTSFYKEEITEKEFNKRCKTSKVLTIKEEVVSNDEPNGRLR